METNFLKFVKKHLLEVALFTGKYTKQGLKNSHLPEFLRERKMDTEVDYEGYKRISIKNPDNDWRLSCDEITNRIEIKFPETKNIYERRIEYFAIYNKENKMMYWGKINNSLSLNKHETPVFSTGTIELKVD